MPFQRPVKLLRSMLTAALVPLFYLPHPSLAASAAAAETEQSDAGYRLDARSSSYNITGRLNDGVLTLRLSRAKDGFSVTGAAVGLTIDGQTGSAMHTGQGVYVYQSDSLKSKKPEREVVVTIEDGKSHDLLVGTLGAGSAGSETGGHQHGHGKHDDHRHGEQGSDTDKHGHSDGKHDHSEDRHDDNHADHADETKDEHKHDGDGSSENAHGHDGHGEDGHGDEHAVKLTPALMREFGVKTARANAGAISKTITRPAEVSYNLDYFTHVVPRVGGIAVSINVSQGDRVEAGQVLAALDSRELAELKAAYLAAVERFDLASQEFRRLKTLRKKGIASEKSYLTARSLFVEARIAVRAARQKLSSIGIDEKTLKKIAKESDATLTRYSMHSPMRGVVVSRHLVKGELVSDQREAFVIADLSSVWVDISVYSSDIPQVRAGQKVVLETETGEEARGTIAFVSPDVSESTRTAKARVVLKGKSESFRPGMFIKARVSISETEVALRVPTTALHVQEGNTVVFAGQNGVFKPKTVKVGRKNEHYAEIIEGLRSGDVFATNGSFLIKAQLSKASFGDGHNH